MGRERCAEEPACGPIFRARLVRVSSRRSPLARTQTACAPPHGTGPGELHRRAGEDDGDALVESEQSIPSAAATESDLVDGGLHRPVQRDRGIASSDPGGDGPAAATETGKQRRAPAAVTAGGAEPRVSASSTDHAERGIGAAPGSTRSTGR